MWLNKGPTERRTEKSTERRNRSSLTISDLFDDFGGAPDVTEGDQADLEVVGAAVDALVAPGVADGLGFGVDEDDFLLSTRFLLLSFAENRDPTKFSNFPPLGRPLAEFPRKMLWRAE